jgi:hypothetical protein
MSCGVRGSFFFGIGCHQTGLPRVGLLNAAKRKGKPMTTKTKKETSNKIFSRPDSVGRWSLATSLRLFAICMKLAACDPIVAVPEYHPHLSHIADSVMVSVRA